MSTWRLKKIKSQKCTRSRRNGRLNLQWILEQNCPTKSKTNKTEIAILIANSLSKTTQTQLMLVWVILCSRQQSNVKLLLIGNKDINSKMIVFESKKKRQVSCCTTVMGTTRLNLKLRSLRSYSSILENQTESLKELIYSITSQFPTNLIKAILIHSLDKKLFGFMVNQSPKSSTTKIPQASALTTHRYAKLT